MEALRRATDMQHMHSLVNLARDGDWDDFHARLDEFDLGIDVFGMVPPCEVLCICVVHRDRDIDDRIGSAAH